MRNNMTTTELALVMETILAEYRQHHRTPSDYDAWNYTRHADRLEQLGFKGAANYYRTAWQQISEANNYGNKN